MSEASPGRIDIPDYELLRQIGRGSYGDVWLARGVTGVFRAVKIVWRDRFADLRPYEREFEGITRFAAVSLREPSQLALLHAGRNDAAGFFYYVMELADDIARGREISAADYAPLTLKEVAQRRPGPAIAEVVELGVQLSRALGSLHAAGLVHRDIKPSNIIFVGGVPKFADVGLVAAASAQLTFVGTEGFVPPEGPGSPAADVFALGKVLYELATGCDRQEFPRLPEGLGQRADRRELLELNEVLLRACEPQPARRHAEAGALLDELLLLQAGKSVRRLRSAERRVTRALRIAAALALIAAVAGAGAYVERRRANEEMALRAQAEAERDALARRTVYAATLAQAQRALEQLDYGRARQLLQAAQTGVGGVEQCGVEWRLLWREAQGDPNELLRDGGPRITRLAYASASGLLAVHDQAGVVELRDVNRPGLRRRVEGVARLAGFSADELWLIGTTPTRQLARWRVDTGEREMAGFAGEVLMPVGARGSEQAVVVTGGAAPAVCVWDFAARRVVLQAEMGDAGMATPWEFFRGALSPDGNELVVASVRGRGTNARFRLSAVALDHTAPPVHQPAPVRPGAVGWLTDAEGRAECWVADDTTGEWATALPALGPWTIQSNPLPVGTTLRSRAGGEDWLAAGVKLARMHDGLTEWQRGGAGLITALAVAPAAHVVFTGSSAGELRAWPQVPPPRGLREHQGWRSATINTVALFSPDGARVFLPESEGVVVELEVATLRETRRFAGMRKPIAVTSSALWGISGDGRSVVRCALAGAAATVEYDRQDSLIVHAVLAPEGNRLVTTRQSGELRWLDLSTVVPRVEAAVSGAHQNLWALQLNNDGSRLWSVSAERQLECRALPGGTVLWAEPLATITPALAWLPRANCVAVALESGSIQLHAADSGRRLGGLPPLGTAPQSLAATADESRLLAVDSEGDLHIYDFAARTLVATWPTGLSESVHNVVVAPTETVAVVSKRGLLRVMRVK